MKAGFYHNQWTDGDDDDDGGGWLQWLQVLSFDSSVLGSDVGVLMMWIKSLYSQRRR